MTLDERRQEILSFIIENCESSKEYTDSLNKTGIKSYLPLFGITLDYTCKLDLEALRKLFTDVLNYYLGRNTKEHNND